MKTLYLFLHTPNTNNIKCVQKMTDEDDAVLFLQNGVYASKLNFDIKSPIYYLKEDTLARGIKINENQLIEYSNMIELIFKFDRVVTF